jgi:hypothetical protein
MSHDETAHVSQQRVQLPANQKSTGVGRVLPNRFLVGFQSLRPSGTRFKVLRVAAASRSSCARKICFKSIYIPPNLRLIFFG